ncbi:MAG: ketoacyl-ACP synthase III [bacterium]
MGFVRFQGVGIAGIAACVPRKVTRNVDFEGPLTLEEIQNTIRTTGIAERRCADKDVCSSDLCCEAAKKLLAETGVATDSIDLLIFLSQTPDFAQPATAPILQHRLGLPKSAGSFDMNLACSGYVYALSTAFAYASLPDVRRVLLLAGETFSKTVSPKDRATCLLFGDAGSATLIERQDHKGVSFFSLSSDGSGESVIRIPAGAYRHPASAETLCERRREDGSVRSDHHLFMDGIEVFNFTMREVPADIRNLLRFASLTWEDVDYVVYHQANKLITDFFAKKLKHPREKALHSLHRFGNTGAVSIPLTLVTEMKESLASGSKRVVLCGYGAGLSWATAALELGGCHLSELVEI